MPGVKQGYNMSWFLFLFVIDRVMNRAVDYYVGTGIKWNITTTLQEADFADDGLVPISSTYIHTDSKQD